MTSSAADDVAAIITATITAMTVCTAATITVAAVWSCSEHFWCSVCGGVEGSGRHTRGNTILHQITI